MKYIFLNRSTQRIGSLLSATLLTLVFLAITPAAFAGKFPSGKETTGWNHHGRIKLCAHPGEKRCPTLAIPRGIKDKDVLAIIRTHIVPNAAHDFVILGKKDSYLCADGYGKKTALPASRSTTR